MRNADCPDLNALAVFRAVAEAGSFRVAADRLGITRSSVSQTIAKLERSIGVSLIRRTTRSLSLTEAGFVLLSSVVEALDRVGTAWDEIQGANGPPSGNLKLAVSSIAVRFLSGSFLAGFAKAYPGIKIDITVTDDEFDIVERGYDAGVGLGEIIDQDMVAVAITREERQVAVCSPSFSDAHGIPLHPRDLTGFQCIGWRPTPDSAPYKWEFAEAGQDFSVSVSPYITTNDMALMIDLAINGAGITFGLVESFRAPLASGQLRPLLEAYCPAFPGFYLYYPSSRHRARKLQALVDYVKAFSRSERNFIVKQA